MNLVYLKERMEQFQLSCKHGKFLISSVEIIVLLITCQQPIQNSEYIPIFFDEFFFFSTMYRSFDKGQNSNFEPLHGELDWEF